jgi:hypothetical protein
MERLFSVALVLVGGVLGALGSNLWWGKMRPLGASLDAQSMRIDALSQRIERLQENQRLALASCTLSALAAPPTVAASASAKPPAPTGAAVARDEFDPKREEALAHGHQLLERAIRSGSWTGEDSLTLRQLSAQLDAERQMELLSTVARALNDGQLKWIGEGSPF